MSFETMVTEQDVEDIRLFLQLHEKRYLKNQKINVEEQKHVDKWLAIDTSSMLLAYIDHL